MDKQLEIACLGEKCCGCGACSAACPRGCITMKPDACGFLKPYVDAEECVGCGACECVCPSLAKRGRDCDCGTFWARAKDDSLLGGSSSGGVFYLLAADVISEGGLVVGAAFDEDLSVRHIAVEDEKGLSALRSSKYVQSSVGPQIYAAVRQAIRDGRKVLFTGTACQIAAMGRYLGVEAASKYYLGVEVVCHGVPSPKLWKAWCENLEKDAGARLIDANFRDKSTGWSSYSVRYRFMNGKFLRRLVLDDWYARAFSRGASLRSSCFDCPVKGSCGADLTLGDFWGIQGTHPFLRWSDGMSAVIVRTDRGAAAFENIRDDVVCGSESYKDLVSVNRAVELSTKRPACYEEFMAALGADESIARLGRTFPFSVSFLQRVVSRLGMIRSSVNRIVGK